MSELVILMPAPFFAELPEMVLLVRARVPVLKMPPPSVYAELSETVLLVRVRVPVRCHGYV